MLWWKKKQPLINKGFLRNLALFFSIMGPGIITANVDNDAGGIATYSIAGAHFGFNFLWLTIPLIFALIVIQEMSARMGAVTGRGFADLIRENFGVKAVFYAMLALLIANLGNTMAEFAGVAASMEIFGISKYISVPVGAFFVWILVVKGTYKTVEKVFLVACLFYVSYIISGFMAKPDWSEVALKTVTPSFQMDSKYIYMLIGIVGTTIAPWMQFYQQAAVVEKGITSENYRFCRWDVMIGSAMALIVVYFIVMVCGQTIYKLHMSEGLTITSAKDAALALEPLAGKYCSMLFAFGLFNASLFAASILPLATAFYVCEGFGWEAGVNKTFKEAPKFYFLYTAIIVIGALIVLIPDFPLLWIMVFSQVINGILLPFILIFMLKLINNSEVMGDFINSRFQNGVAGVTTVVMIALTLAMAVTSFL